VLKPALSVSVASINRAFLFCASGDSLYLGAAVLILAVFVSPRFKSRASLLLRNIACWIALGMMVMASPPFSYAVDVLFFAMFLVWFFAVASAAPHHVSAGLRFGSGALLVTILALMAGSELRHRQLPMIHGIPADHFAVIGDSISAGIGSGATPWPTQLAQMTGVTVKNLAKPGAGIADGMAMAAQVTPDDHVIVVELGGNDMLSGTPSPEFGRDLEALLAELSAPGRIVVMFELPLIPSCVAYGQIQRQEATKYGVWLIPKKHFADVLSGRGATLDGLHLSQEGSRKMALLMKNVLSPVLRPA
jgi:lysophospholipase L1-like esterase